ncbi:adenosinetriphosphatase [Capronia coronata CBS 617.96]|uniref:Adenosinetriphosphatase n=1 Tax=Capronia coronata CBS 617.96 TaxID=1182541 RepID=W9YTL3_9EURO|nr:adenosinetriphosphatase [Capronia coronata CBS 617.96]EXJ96252.1 adenosinetriphosphatase [Capronia coronata CBS 617.96]
MGARRRPARSVSAIQTPGELSRPCISSWSTTNRRFAAFKVATPREPSLPVPTKTSKRTTRTSQLAEIPDSDDVEDFPLSESVSKSTFQGVFVNNNVTTSAKPGSSRPDSTAPSSIADTMDSSSYETAGTSTVPTPNLIDQSSKSRVGATARALQLQTSQFALRGGQGASKKRTILDLEMDDDDPEDMDFQLASRLQAEEYNVVADSEDSDALPLPKRPRTQRKPDRAIAGYEEVLDSEDDSDDDIPLAKSQRTRAVQKSSNHINPTDVSDDSDEDSELSSIVSVTDTDASDFIANLGLGTGSLAGYKALAAAQSSDDEPLVPRAGRRRGRIHEFGEMFILDPVERRRYRERKRLERAHPDIKTMWDKLASVAPIKPVPAQQPSGISRQLKGFQLEGLDWMMKQEKSQWKGGLLGDEMGMGKTIQAVSLIMSDWPAKSPTLVVVPPVALMQWQAEIKDYTSGKLNVLIYHISANPKCKQLSLKDLKKYDVIMVSYSGLESMFRKENKGWNRNDGIVKEESLLHAIKYHRIILDEAHSIKQRTTSVSKACFALKADYKWCLSGTPVQNRIGEFFSLLRFLEVKPFACYFCKECKCRQLHWSQDASKMCTSCKHSGFNHVSVFNQEILNPITQGEKVELRQKGLDKLRLITDRIMLRRMKRDHTSSMELPPKDVVIHNEFFGEIERDFSQSIMSNSNRKFDTYVAQGVMLNNYANIFGLIMQMRQVADHPDLILRKNAEGGQNILVCCICDEPAEDAIRSRCRHEFCRQCAKSYIQSFAGGGGGGDADCPRCHIPLVIDWDQPEIEQDEENVKKSSIINRIKMEDWTSSTKIEMLVYDLYKLRSKKQTHKSIVFSQFTSMLQLVQWRLQKSGFSTVLLDGSMSPAQRQKSIDHFMTNVDCEVFLVSLKAGGVALNLTEASRVYIIDPWWNPAAEWQSADRCHRIGQRRPCVITRLVIEDSVESRIVLLQEKKANMINGTVNNDQVALDKLTPEDMQFLFRGS